MNLEEIEDKYVNTPVSMEQAEKLLTDYLPILIAEVKRLRKELGSANDAIVLLKTRLKQLQKAVELEHDQGESFLVQIKELRKDKERLEKQVEQKKGGK